LRLRLLLVLWMLLLHLLLVLLWVRAWLERRTAAARPFSCTNRWAFDAGPRRVRKLDGVETTALQQETTVGHGVESSSNQIVGGLLFS
jgi:hypothetical protein